MRLDFALAVVTCALLTGCAINPPMCHETRSKAESNLEPEYPKASKLQGEEGKTVLQVMVNALGFPETIEVKTSSGFENLDRAAVNAVKTWCFNPATKDGKYVAASLVVPLEFHLPRRPPARVNFRFNAIGQDATPAPSVLKTTREWARAVVRSFTENIICPPDTPKNTEVVFSVEQTLDGEIVRVTLKSSSGFAPYDAAAERAILKSSPLPKFPNPQAFPKEFEMSIRPFEKPETTASSN